VTRLAGALALVAALALGLLAGAMLLIAVALVPYWTSLEPAEFARWFRDHASLIGRLMIPLGVAAAALTALAAWLARPAPASRWLLLAAGLATVVGALYPVYFSAANASIASGALAPDEVAAELRRWRTWHAVRTAAGLAAFLAALRALRDARP
jgi:hypothetical protein